MDIERAYLLISQKLAVWMRELIRLMPNILLASVVLVLGIYLSRRIRKLSTRIMRKMSSQTSLHNLFSSMIYVFCMAVTFFTVLSILKLDKAVTSILAGAGILGLALAFAFQDIAANFISGIFIAFRHPIRVGHIVKIKEFMGKVEEVNLRDTVIRTFQGQMVILPNKDVFQNPIENYSLLGKRRFDLEVGVSYAENLKKVKQITLDALRDLPGISPEDEITFFYNKFDESSINYTLRIWICSPDQPIYLETGSEAIMRIKEAYDSSGIVIPWPIRTLDFGPKGGVGMEDILPKSGSATQEQIAS